MTTMRAPAAWRRRLAPSCRRPQAEPAERPDRPDPQLGDRRRRRPRGPVRPAQDGLRRRHGVGALAGVHRGLHPRAGAADVRQHPHRGVGHRPPHDRAARAGPRRHPPGRQRRRRRRRALLRRRARPARSTSSSACSSSSARQRPVVFIGPYEHHSNELPWRESVADVVTIREDDEGRVDLEHLEHELRRHADRPREDRQLLRRVERDRDRDRRRPGLDRAAPLRRAVVLGLRRRRPVPADRHERGARHPERAARVQGRGLRLAAQVHRRPRHAGRARGQALAVAQPRPLGARRRDDPLRQPDRALLPPRPGDPRGGRHARHRRVDPRRARVRAQGGGRQRRDPPPRARLRAARAAPRGPTNPQIEILGNPDLERLAIVSLGLRHPPGLLHANFVVAVLSDLFGIQARSGCFCAGPLHPPHVPDRRRVVAAHGRRGREGPPGRQARVHPAELQLLHQRDGLRLHRRRRPPGRRRGLEAAAAVPLRSRLRPLAAPRRRARSAAEPARLRRGARRHAGALRHRARERAGRPARGRAARSSTLQARPPAGAVARPGAQRGFRAHPLVPAPGRGARAAADLRRRTFCSGA